jgi:hypothetical protein
MRHNDLSLCLIAIVYIMSKCKYVVCTSGNISIWITYFRENSNNIYHYLNDKSFDMNFLIVGKNPILFKILSFSFLIISILCDHQSSLIAC